MSKPSDNLVEYSATLGRTRVIPAISSLLEDAMTVAGSELSRLSERSASGGTMTDADVRRLTQVVASLKTLKEVQRMVEEDENLSDKTTEELEQELLGHAPTNPTKK